MGGGIPLVDMQSERSKTDDPPTQPPHRHRPRLAQQPLAGVAQVAGAVISFKLSFSFGKPRERGRPTGPEVAATRKLKVNAARRLKAHTHVKQPNTQNCNLATAIRVSGARQGKKFSLKHDGADLLVFRIE